LERKITWLSTGGNIFVNITIFDPCIDDRRYISVFIEELEDAKGVIRIRKSKKNRQHNFVDIIL
jgi:hypothetical protein